MKHSVYGIYDKTTDKILLSDKGREIYFNSYPIAFAYCSIHPKDVYTKNSLVEYDETKHKIAGIK